MNIIGPIILITSFLGIVISAFVVNSKKKKKKDLTIAKRILIAFTLILILTAIIAKITDPGEQPLSIDIKDDFTTNEEGISKVKGKTGKNVEVLLVPYKKSESKTLKTTSDSKGTFSFTIKLPKKETLKEFKIHATDGERTGKKKEVIVFNNSKKYLAYSENQESIEESSEKNQESTEPSEDNNMKDVLDDAITDADVSDYKIKIEGNNAIISYPINSFWNADSLVTVTYPKDVEKILENLQGAPFENVIIQSTTTFIDNKGNESEGLAISTFFTKQTLDSINFANWSDQISSDGTVLYSASDGYMIQNSLLNESKGKTKTKIGNAGKSNDSDWWTNNGYIELK
ncbi:hypothetical protein P7D40_09060 [Enterococcus dongliensis]|uniref:hypothetical protein n=1 Tax=Enterococcus dongliensis TaxID=2559925 RepID=UPI00288EA11D|nr:hypothetical protein [Enterococcus dongliensis]MDT2635038.1 hypothetical protein [Enterococcus dongliensis]